jgi:hypothetical protein
MKISQPQTDYLKAQILLEAAQAAYMHAMTTQNEQSWDAAFDLVELRKEALLVWGAEKAVSLTRQLGKPESDLKLVTDLFKRIQKGEHILYKYEQRLIGICLQLTA